MQTVLDIETTFQKLADGGSDNRPYHPDNKLVSIGLKQGVVGVYYPVQHKHVHLESGRIYSNKMDTQAILNRTTLLIGHNIKFDLSWMRECGYVYDGLLWDTMLVEKVLSGGALHANELGLSMCCARRGIATKKDTVKEYWDRGVPTDEIPWDILMEYGINDINITEQLFKQQYKEVYGY